ncbi:MAG: acyl carrier protein [Phycisphaeraceae bacterium]|nr:acyl carrier protein [Phycisphaeraceae bacterium]
MAFNRSEIETGVREVLCDALGVDADEVTPTARIKADLGAESIDYLDIMFRLEKKFSTPERPFKIPQGELFPENMLSDPTLVEAGRVTDKGMAMLKERMPHVDFTTFEHDRAVATLQDTFTVKSLVDFVERKLGT